MPYLTLERDTDQDDGASSYEPIGAAIQNGAAMNGYYEDERDEAINVAQPLGWMNWASVETRPEDDAVQLCVSIGDPRGAFSFTVRRLPDGRVVIHVPTPDDGEKHMPLAKLHTGTLVVTSRHRDGDTPANFNADPHDLEGDEDE